MSRLCPVARLRYHYFRYGNNGGGVKLDNKSTNVKYQSKNIHLLYIDISVLQNFGILK